MRRTRHGKTDWVEVKWKGGVMPHPVQQDGSSCGIIVVKVSHVCTGGQYGYLDVSMHRRCFNSSQTTSAYIKQTKLMTIISLEIISISNIQIFM